MRTGNRWRRALEATSVVAVLAAGLVMSAAPAAAAPGTIVTIAGSFTPEGAATTTGIDAVDIAVRGTSMYVTEHQTVRRVDLSTGSSMVIAGTDRFFGSEGDGGPATAARLGHDIEGAAVNGEGDVYIADTDNNRVRRIVPGADGVVNGGEDEIITTIAGTTSGFSGDGGPATSAQIERPEAVTLDASGNLLVGSGSRVRRVAAGSDGVVNGGPGETITTVVGTGAQGFAGDGGPGRLAQLGRAFGARFDSFGTMFLADGGNGRVRAVVPGADGIVNGGADETITTVAGGGPGGDGSPATAAALSNVGRLAFDAVGNLLVSEAAANRVRKVVTGGDGRITGATDEIVATVAGTGVFGYSGDGGAATSAMIGYPGGVAFDASGSLYFADGAQYRVRKVDPAGAITTVAGNGARNFGGDGGPATKARLAALGLGPAGVATDAFGNLFIADQASRIRRVDTSGTITTVAGRGLEVGSPGGFSGDGGPALAADLNFPQGVAVDRAGNLLIADTASHRIRRVLAGADGVVSGAADETITTVAGSGIVGPVEGENGAFGGDGGPATAALLSVPRDLAVDSAGTIVIADTGNNRIRKVDAAGTITTLAGSGPTGLGVLGGFSGDGGPATAAELSFPYGVSVDYLDNVLIADALNNRIRRVDAAGTITTVAGSGPAGVGSPGSFSGDRGPATGATLNRPYDVGADENGSFFVVDNGNNRVRQVTSSGVITTVAGNSTAGGLGGDGGPATSAQLGAPVSVAVDTSGNLFVTEPLRVRRVEAAPRPPGVAFHALTPRRILDSRPPPNQVGPYGTPWGPAQTRGATVVGVASGAPPEAEAVVLNVTVTDTTSDGYLTMWPAGQPQPLASSLNWAPGQTIPNAVTVKVGVGGQVSVFNAAGNADVIVDLVGYYSTSPGGGFTPVDPTRISDSRPAPNQVGAYGTPWGPGQVRDVTVTGSGVPVDADAVVLNVTATDTTAAGYLTIWPTGQAQPLASSLNWAAGQTIPNAVTVKVGAGGRVSVYNAVGTADVIVDVVGSFASGRGQLFHPLSPTRLLDSRPVGPQVGPYGSPWPALAARDVQVIGFGGVPGRAGAALLNVTATDTTAASYLTIWPAGLSAPVVSSLNWAPGRTIANSVTAKPGAAGRISVRNAAGSVNVIADTAGWYG